MEEQPPITDAYFDLLAQRDQLEAGAANAGRLTRDLYEQALAAANHRLSAMEENPVLQAAMRDLRPTAARALTELDLLQPSVESGLLSSAVVDATRPDRIGHPRLLAATD